MAANSNEQEVSVLTVEAVRWGIEALQAQRVHPWFLAYLQLRKRAAEEGDAADIKPKWEELAPYLELPGGPPNKPFYRPLWNGGGSDPGRYWLNPNLAGSYSPSSVRALVRKVVITHGSHFELRPGHTEAAFQFLLNEIRVPAVAFATYLYRDYGFTAARNAEPTDLISVLQRHFRFFPDDPEFPQLFVELVPPSVTAWFEPVTAKTPGVT